MYSAEKGPLFVLSLDFIVCRYISYYMYVYVYLFKYIYTTAGKGKPFLCFLVLYFYIPILGCFLRKYSCFLFAFLWGGSVDFNNRNF